jgi:hypothetical protein
MKVHHVIAFAIGMTVIAQTGRTQSHQPQNTAVPSVLSYHGVLNTNQGVIDGTVELTVALYSDPISNFKIWEDTYRVRVERGAFSVKLGSGKTPLPQIGANQQLWLRFTANGTAIPGLTEFHASDFTVNIIDNSRPTADAGHIPGLGDNLVYDDQR